MIDPVTASMLAFVLFVAGLLEWFHPLRAMREWLVSSRLMALGMFLLGGRVAYLVYTNDLSRLSLWGTAPIAMIALSRIMACAKIMRDVLNGRGADH